MLAVAFEDRPKGKEKPSKSVTRIIPARDAKTTALRYTFT